MAFGFDLTPYLQPDDNVISVRTDNRWDYREQASNSTVQWNNINFYSNFGGINKRVWLHITPAVHQTLPLYSSLGTTGQYIWADNFDLAAHVATIHIDPKCAMTVLIRKR
jgi:beta-galactosidase